MQTIELLNETRDLVAGDQHALACAHMTEAQAQALHERERAAVRTDPAFAEGLRVWKLRATARAKLTEHLALAAAVEKRIASYTGELGAITAQVRPENRSLVFW